MTKVLFAQPDAITRIGGGESASRRLYNSPGSPSVVWPVKNGEARTLPPGHYSIPYPSAYLHWLSKGARSQAPTDDHAFDFAQAFLAAELAIEAGCDHIDVPEYLTFSRFLPAALTHLNHPEIRVVVGMHGRVSETLRWELFDDFDEHALFLKRLREKETLCLQTADVRYAISEKYVSTLSIDELPVILVDPFLCLPPPSQQILCAETSPPLAVFVGRTERCKGLDLFVQMLWEARPSLEDRHAVYGRIVRPLGKFFFREVIEYCRVRRIPLKYKGELDFTRLQNEVLSRPSLVVVPSRYDSFNLVALEALLHGQPVLVSPSAGVHHFLSHNLAHAPAWQTFDLNNPGCNAERALWMLDRFNRLHKDLWEYWQEHPPEPDTSSFAKVFDSPSTFSEEARAYQNDLFMHLLRKSRGNPRPFVEIQGSKPQPAQSLKFPFFKRRIGAQAVSPFSQDSDNWIDQALVPFEDSAFARDEPFRQLYEHIPQLFRNQALLRLAEIEERKGRLDVAAAYRLRLVRSHASAAGCNADHLRALLEALGKPREAALLPVWLSPPEVASEIATSYLRNQLQLWKEPPPADHEVLFDLRHTERPKVTVIVSLYEVSREILRLFTERLSRQTMLTRGEAEVIFVDSGSPTNQAHLLATDQRSDPLPAMMIRTAKRETIQMAWNRAISLARGSALAFLGVDERLHPEALDLLWEALQQSPLVDWVTADAVVSSVDSAGRWRRDIMKYDRRGLSLGKLLFDTTYLGFVPGLYRRTLHDQFGYYDPTFKGAGDTEFKLRCCTSLKLRHIPCTLGEYLDFPGPRTTNSAEIEIEDLRAWYLFRTRPGIEYLFSSCTPELLSEVFWDSLSAGRSWVRRPESDLHFARHLLWYARDCGYPLPELQLLNDIEWITSEMRELLFAQPRHTTTALRRLRRLARRSTSFFKKCTRLKPDLAFPKDFTSDMLYKSHGWLW